jgi:hypothetical protein
MLFEQLPDDEADIQKTSIVSVAAVLPKRLRLLAKQRLPMLDLLA